MSDKNIVIWGAGKIGRGFIADIFFKNGYKITFIDNSKELIEKLNHQGYYKIENIPSKAKRETVKINNYEALHISEKDKINEALLKTNLLAISVFPEAFEEITKFITAHIKNRIGCKKSDPLNIILCTNIPNPGRIFRELIEKYLDDEFKSYFKKNIGILEAVIIRIAVEPFKNIKDTDSLSVVTNGYKPLIIDKANYIGPIPQVEGIRFTENIEAEEKRKIYTYNMIHAVYAYLGKLKNYTMIIDSINNEDINFIAKGALDEVSQALQIKFNFTKEEMEKWNNEVLINMANPILKDTINRVGKDPIRKLKRDDRLIGPALICREYGIMPYFLSIAIASAFLFYNPEDPASAEITDFLRTYSIEDALIRYSGLNMEIDLIYLIKRAFERIKNRGIDNIKGEKDNIDIVKKAYNRGFINEATIRGCAQCALKALAEVTGKLDKNLFQAASGLSGGIAITGDGSCGGYIAGVLFMGSYAGRRFDFLDDGDKGEQYRSYYMAQELHDNFIEAFGSVTCKDIHKRIFGRAYCLRTKAIRNDFEEAGGHKDKCTNVIGLASAMTVEILIKYGYIKIK